VGFGKINNNGGGSSSIRAGKAQSLTVPEKGSHVYLFDGDILFVPPEPICVLEVQGVLVEPEPELTEPSAPSGISTVFIHIPNA